MDAGKPLALIRVVGPASLPVSEFGCHRFLETKSVVRLPDNSSA
jgi:hypothetical protein